MIAIFIIVTVLVIKFNWNYSWKTNQDLLYSQCGQFVIIKGARTSSIHPLLQENGSIVISLTHRTNTNAGICILSLTPFISYIAWHFEKLCHDVNVSLLNDLVFLPVKVFSTVDIVGRYATNKSNWLCNLWIDSFLPKCFQM